LIKSSPKSCVVRLGTRGSLLALAQTRLVEKALKSRFRDVTVETVVIKTSGDVRRFKKGSLKEVPSYGKGLFVKELEESLRRGFIDMAVHSLKDLPTRLPEGLTLAAVLEREDARDCLVSQGHRSLAGLEPGSLVGTNSLRRQAQILAAYPRLRVVPVRGNVDTRMRRVKEGALSAVVLARAGLLRLGRADEATQIFSLKRMMPAAGQGFIGIEIRRSDRSARRWAEGLNHLKSFCEARAERAFLDGLGGGCRIPAACWARIDRKTLRIDGLVMSPDGQSRAAGSVSGSPRDPDGVGRRLARTMVRAGALSLWDGEDFCR